MIRYIWIVLLFLVSCSVFDGKDDTSKIELEKAWEVVEFIDEDGNTIPLIEDEDLTLRFGYNKSIGGEAACNQYGGEYIAKKSGNLTIRILFATEFAGPQPSLGDDFLTALSDVSEYETENGRLFLFFGDEGKLTFFERIE